MDPVPHWRRFVAHAEGRVPDSGVDRDELAPEDQGLAGECGRCLRARQLLTDPGWDIEVFRVAWEIACEGGRPALESYQLALSVLSETHADARSARA